MLIYNKITELRYDQFIILFVVEIAIILVTLLLFKKKLSFKSILFSSIIAIVLSLISMVVVNGFYGGMAYHERFGWPFQFQGISRSIEDTLIPYAVGFDIWKLLANTIYWGIFPLLVLFEILSRKRSKKYQLFIIGSLTFFILLTIFFSYINNPSRSEERVDEVTETTMIDYNSELSAL